MLPEASSTSPPYEGACTGGHVWTSMRGWPERRPGCVQRPMCPDPWVRSGPFDGRKTTAGSAGAGRLSEVCVVAAVAAAILASFVVVYPLRGFRVPLGSDTPVYEWWAR